MNPDRVIGTAVLVTSGPIQWLYYLKVGTNIEGVSRDSLPVMPEGGPTPTEKLPSHFPENNPWKYRIEGDTLHVHPSINIKDFWHNDGTWSVKFTLATGADHDAHVKQLLEADPDLDLARLWSYERERLGI